MSFNPSHRNQSSTSRSRSGPRHNLSPHQQQENDSLRRVSKETNSILPLITESTPLHPPDGFLITPPNPPQLNQTECPGFTNVKIQIIQDDTLDVAISLIDTASSSPEHPSASPYGHPCILNMASERNPGGGWLGTAKAQEEAISRRSTLTRTLRKEFYPLPPRSAVYSPSIVVFRNSKDSGHGLLDLKRPELYPVLSAISIAAVRRPAVVSSAGSGSGSRKVYANAANRELMKDKMRIVLRISVWKGHRKIVLGALGCGAFGNPKEEVADCWAEVFGETEFQGGWWKEVVFAILDPPPRNGEEGRQDGNAEVFTRRLSGLAV